MDSSDPSYQSLDCVIKWRNQFINSIRFFFHLSLNVYHVTEKTAEMSLKEWVAKDCSASATL